ncbi:MAG: hypothetical protein QOJ35_2105 [Solirubrobacteraceae bacterium]|jgi:hypothetical protein|nr:hypothetical protein [Solirubrobacteraceae bacterium]
MILLCGVPSEPPLRLVADALQARGADVVMFNQRNFADCRMTLEIAGADVGGRLSIAGEEHELERFGGLCVRVMDDRCLPELDGEPADSARRRRCRSLHETLMRWLEVAPGCVVNRSAPSGSNMSKPFQAQLISPHGLLVPETLITDDPALVGEFQARHGRVVYKSISGVRSVVQTLEEADDARLDRIRWCPTQFQALVEGIDVRVHVVDDEVYAAAVSSSAVDYRYAIDQTGEPARLREVVLSDELAERCVALARGLGLVLAGIDLRVTADDEVYCFEVNPQPAFSYYEHNTGLPIADAIARCLIAGRAGTRAPACGSVDLA